MHSKYTVEHFINKFSAIPEDKWTVNVFINDKGQCCALGHLGARYGSEAIDESQKEERQALSDLFYNNISSAGPIVVNDGKCSLFQQETPKARIMAALEYIKKTEKLNNT